ncbi:MAG: ABC transporter ATP-binding protein [Acidimicrobiales bacterium]|nr:ABC transporter ATP-binding protein [Acidimicrobiales bacterium]MCB9395626.1 ABC transporter ATP-binding protein [Acidimicrobiaceae bacterium]
MSSSTSLTEPTPGGHALELRDVTVRFGSTLAVDAVTTTIPAGAIVGLLGRNGAGKSTLLRTLAAHRRPSDGTVRVAGEDPYEHERLMADLCLVRHDGDFNLDVSVADSIAIAAALRPHWDGATLDRLMERFRLQSNRTKVGALSLGQRAALAVSIGIATRSPVTMFDEPHLGLDAPSRYAFYDELLATYIAMPRTIIVSTHLIDEVASLLEHVLIIDRGALLVHEPADELRTRGLELTGPSAAVDEITGGMAVLSSRTLGPTTSAVVFGEDHGDLQDRAAAAGVEVGPIPLQDLFVAMTSQESVR